MVLAAPRSSIARGFHRARARMWQPFQRVTGALPQDIRHR